MVHTREPGAQLHTQPCQVTHPGKLQASQRNVRPGRDGGGATLPRLLTNLRQRLGQRGVFRVGVGRKRGGILDVLLELKIGMLRKWVVLCEGAAEESGQGLRSWLHTLLPTLTHLDGSVLTQRSIELGCGLRRQRW